MMQCFQKQQLRVVEISDLGQELVQSDTEVLKPLQHISYDPKKFKSMIFPSLDCFILIHNPKSSAPCHFDQDRLEPYFDKPSWFASAQDPTGFRLSSNRTHPRDPQSKIISGSIIFACFSIFSVSYPIRQEPLIVSFILFVFNFFISFFLLPYLFIFQRAAPLLPIYFLLFFFLFSFTLMAH